MKRKNTKRKLLVLFVLMFAFMLTLAACSSSETSKDGDGKDNDNQAADKDDKDKSDDGDKLADKQELNFTEGDEIRSMDISVATDTISHGVMNRVFSGLLIYENDELVGELAEDLPKVNDDYTEYTFTLRDGIEWDDGTPIKAEDFVYSWRRALSTDIETQYAYIFEAANIKNADKISDEDSDMFGKTDKLGVEAVDDKTLKVTLSKSTPEQYFNSLMQFAPFFPLNKDFVEKQGDKYAQEPENLIYSGPYKLEKWSHGEGWTLAKNDNYWNADKVSIDKVNYKIVKDPKTALKLYESGEIDRVGLTSEDVDKYKDDKEFKQLPDVSVFYWDFDRDKVPEFKNKKLRQALFLSLDRKSGTDVILNNGSMPANYVVPKEFATGPDGKDFHEAGGIADPESYLNTDKEKAKKLWKEAKKELGIDKLEVEMMTTDGEVAIELAEYYVNQMTSNLDGLKVTINKQPFKSYLDLTSKGEVELAAGSGWSPDYEDPMTFLELFTSNNPQNTYGLADKEYDKLIKDANDAGDDPEKRWELLQKAENHLINDALIIPTYQKGSSVLTKSYIDGNVDQVNGIQNFIRYAKIFDH